MILEITEEEREFLERLCKRTYAFSIKDIPGAISINKEQDLFKLNALMKKLLSNMVEK